MDDFKTFDEAGYIAYVIALLVCFAGWLTHVIYCIQATKYMLLIAGALFFPVGVVHGFGIWFGAWY